MAGYFVLETIGSTDHIYEAIGPCFRSNEIVWELLAHYLLSLWFLSCNGAISLEIMIILHPPIL